MARRDIKNPPPRQELRLPADRIAHFRANPMAFFEAVKVRSAKGVVSLGTIMAEHQREWLTALSPALVCVSNGTIPATGKFFWEGTKGSGKDFCLALSVIWLLMASSRPLYCQIGAADRDQADELRKSAKGILRLNPWLNRIEVQNWKIVCAASDCECEIIAADVAGSHGARPDVLVLNELHAIEDGKWEFAENLLDNASKVPNGLVVIATNAGFTGTDAYRWREMARTSPRWSFHQYAKPAPWLDDQEIAEAQQRNSPQRFGRLFRGQWSSGAGDALDPDDIKAAITLEGPMGGRDIDYNGWQFVGGLDLGVKHDHSAFVVLGVEGGGTRIRLCYAQSWKPPRGGQVNVEAIENTIAQVHSRMFLRSVDFDPSQALFLAQRLRRYHAIVCNEMKFVGVNLDLMATMLMEVFRTRMLDLYDYRPLIRDLGRITIEEKEYGHRLSAVADADGHADTATALAIALPAARRMVASGRRIVAQDHISRNIQAPNGSRFVPTARMPLRRSVFPWILKPEQLTVEEVEW